MYKINHRDNRPSKKYFFNYVGAKASSKRSQIPSPTHLLMNCVSEKMKIYYSEKLFLNAHPFVGLVFFLSKGYTVFLQTF